MSNQPTIEITGPGRYIMRNGVECLVLLWIDIPGHPDGGHWQGVTDPHEDTAYSPFNSWTKDGRDCEGATSWGVVAKADQCPLAPDEDL